VSGPVDCVPPWDSKHWESPRGLDDSDDDKRVAWELRASLSTPEWALTDPRLDATDKLVCTALEVLSRGAEFVRTDIDALTERLRLYPSELTRRLLEPLERLRSIDVVVPVARGGFLLRRHAGVTHELELAEHINESLICWHKTLDDDEKKTVMDTLAKVLRSKQ